MKNTKLRKLSKRKFSQELLECIANRFRPTSLFNC